MYRDGIGRLPAFIKVPGTRLLAAVLTIVFAAYILWKIGQSPDQALQFAFNGLAVGAVYALLAMGFTIVYSTVWFFDLYYGAAAALGAYGVFYLSSQETLQGRYQVDNLYISIVFGAVTGGVVAWALREGLSPRLRRRLNFKALRVVEGVLAASAGIYTGFLLAYPDNLNLMLSPVIGVLIAIVVGWLLYEVFWRIMGRAGVRPFTLAAPGGAVLGVYCGTLVASTTDFNLYLSWGVSCLMAGAVGLALYRGLYMYMRQRARSPLIMLVASLGVLLAITALTTIVFQPTPKPLPEAFASEPWIVGKAHLKGFNIFAIGVALLGFVGLLALLKKTSFGKAVRAIGDDEEVSKVVGINTTTVIAVVFFIGAVFAALAGILSGHDTAIQPRMGLLLLLKGWIASVIGGIGNLYGALVGGFALGLVEQFGIWDLAGEWKDPISFILLILFLAFWPKGLLARR